MYYYNARYYDPLTGQFTQPDTLVADPLNPAAWNRFSYVYGNPVNLVDPSGHVAIAPWDLLDILSFGASLNDFIQEPSLANAGWLALDTISLLPLIPAVGAIHHAGKLDEAGDVIRYASRSSGHPRQLQRAIIEGLGEGEIVAFRGMDWGWGTWARKGYDIPFKPHEATWTWRKGENGLRLTNAGVFLSDLDAAWALDRTGMMILDKDFMKRAAAINEAYGKTIVMHGTHWQGIIHNIELAVATANGKNYLSATVYVYGKNINGVV